MVTDSIQRSKSLDERRNLQPTHCLTMKREINVILLPLFFGLLIMTIPGLTSAASDTRPNGELLLTDFTKKSADLGWYVVNDNVMGGRSEGDFAQEEGTLVFTGRTNTNGGGFSSIRTQPMQLNLSSHARIQLRVLGDGRRYTWRLTTPARWRDQQVSYSADFETQNGTWSTVNIPFSSFTPGYRGNRLNGPALDPAKITGMGLMINDNQDGPFELRLASVRANSAEAPFTLLQYKWKKRVLVVSAPTQDDKNLIEMRKQLALTAEEFASRDIALMTLLDGEVSTVEDRELTTEEATSARLALEIPPGSFALRLIGKDGSVKLSGDTATPMTEIYALIDTMPMRRREITGR